MNLSMKLRNNSTTADIYVYLLGNLIVPKNMVVSVPSYFTDEQVRHAIRPFPDLTLLGGYVVTEEDVIYDEQAGVPGIMSKDVYDTNYDGIVDEAEVALSGGGGGQSSISVNFTFSDFANSSKVIGTVLANRNVNNTKLIVDSIFDNGTITVGDSLEPNRLMGSSDNALGYANTYVSELDYLYTTDTVVNLYFTGSPTEGSGRVVISLS